MCDEVVLVDGCYIGSGLLLFCEGFDFGDGEEVAWQDVFLWHWVFLEFEFFFLCDESGI